MPFLAFISPECLFIIDSSFYLSLDSHEVTLLKHKLEEAEKSLREMILVC